MIPKRARLAIAATLLAAEIVSTTRAWVSEPEGGWQETSSLELAEATGFKDPHGEEYPSIPMRANRANENTNKEKTERRKIGKPDRQAIVPGTPGKDYPDHTAIPVTSFTCLNKRAGGYYTDFEAGCQVFHVCNVGGAKSSFLCPTGSIFNQIHLVCDWWYSYNCAEAKAQRDEKFFESVASFRDHPSPASPKSRATLSRNEFTGDPIVVPSQISRQKNTSPHEKSLENKKIGNIQKPKNEISRSGERQTEMMSLWEKSLEKSSFPLDKRNGDRDHGYSNRSRITGISKSRNELVRRHREKIPRGFSRYSGEDNNNEMTTRFFDSQLREPDNDVAMYVNYAYFEASSNDRHHKFE